MKKITILLFIVILFTATALAENSYTMEFQGLFGSEIFTLSLSEDGSCTLSSSNPMLGSWEGEYTANGNHVSVVSLKNPETGEAPTLWVQWFDPESGACEVDLSEDGTFSLQETGAAVVLDLPMNGVNPDALYYGDLPEQTFQMRSPDGTGPFPALIVVPGGAFRFVDGGSFEKIADYFCEQGVLVIQLNYAVGAGTYPQAIIDVKTAVQYVWDHADELKADINELTVLGCSAGGYLAAMAVLTPADMFTTADKDYTYKVRNLVDFFGATEWMSDPLYEATGAGTPESQWVGSDVSSMSSEERSQINPLTWLDTEDVSKVWVSHGDADRTMPILNSEIFYDAVKDVVADAHFEVLEGADHEDAAFYTPENLGLVYEFIH